MPGVLAKQYGLPTKWLALSCSPIILGIFTGFPSFWWLLINFLKASGPSWIPTFGITFFPWSAAQTLSSTWSLSSGTRPGSLRSIMFGILRKACWLITFTTVMFPFRRAKDRASSPRFVWAFMFALHLTSSSNMTSCPSFAAASNGVRPNLYSLQRERKSINLIQISSVLWRKNLNIISSRELCYILFNCFLLWGKCAKINWKLKL